MSPDERRYVAERVVAKVLEQLTLLERALAYRSLNDTGERMDGIDEKISRLSEEEAR